MPRILDNIDEHMLPALTQTLAVSKRADFCVGYFNLRGWKKLDSYVGKWPGGEGHCCRLMVGMQRTPQDELREALRLGDAEDGIDKAQSIRLKRKLAEEFRRQLMLGAPSNEDEAGLRRLAQQLRDGKLTVKLFLRHPLHAKLYLLFRDDFNNPITGYLGSSNLTFAGLSYQGELNVDVLDHDACQKLARWFDQLWSDTFCLDISAELIQVIEESWAGRPGYTPYEIYLKMAYHLAQEARAGVSEFALPPEFERKLFPFQKEAVKIAARYLNRRGGVLIGDVVGLGKTLMATALARVFEDDTGVSTLIICPKNLVKMWQGYVHEYGLRGKVISSSMVVKDLPEIPARFRQVIIDESHNLRNREGKRYRAIQEYIGQSDSRCILVTATPYNKSYLDLSAQLRLFIPDDHQLGIRPEHLLREIDEVDLQTPPNTLAAFEKSDHADDWRELMRLYLVRRTRSFIKTYYAERDADGRYYLRYADGSPAYFPQRKPLTLAFPIRRQHQYAKLYSERVVEIINALGLPRYGMANYLQDNAHALANAAERPLLANLSRAGKRLIAYCRTNLYKRLESSGEAFTQSLDRHILRNYVFLYALENGKPLPIGTQDAEMLDPGNNDEDADTSLAAFDPEADEAEAETFKVSQTSEVYTEASYRARAKQVYETFRREYKSRFKWIKPALFRPELGQRLHQDAQNLMAVLQESGPWQADQDRKLARLYKLLTEEYPHDKVLIFTQFADTVHYLTAELKRRGVQAVEGVTGASPDPTGLAWRFSPVSNGKEKDFRSLQDFGSLGPDKGELRVLVATDVLSEGQNLQDAHIVVNYDLPWAIIRLIQRAGRVDRIGQKAELISCFTFLPADGVEEIIKLRARVRQRLRENGEVIGADEQFFESEQENQDLRNLYTEKSGILDDEAERDDTDPASQAYAIWQAVARDHPELAHKVETMPDVVLSTRAHDPMPGSPEGVLVYMRTADDLDLLGRVDENGQMISESPLAVLHAAACEPDTPAVERAPNHHELVKTALTQMARELKSSVGKLGKSSGIRYRVYRRLSAYYDDLKAHAPLLATEDLARTIDMIYRYPLREAAKDILNRQIKAGMADADLARLAITLRSEDRLCLVAEEGQPGDDPRIICSLGLCKTSEVLKTSEV